MNLPVTTEPAPPPLTAGQLRAYADLAGALERRPVTAERAIRSLLAEVERLRAVAPAEPPSDGRLREIAEMAEHLAAERRRINAPAPEGRPPVGTPDRSKLCAWACRGEEYLATIRANPPEEIYRALLAEIAALRGRLGEANP